MKPVILISGELTPERLEEIRREMERYRELCFPGEEMHLVIDSPGGNSFKTLEFLEHLHAVTKSHELCAKIYRAGSSAALIALCAHHRDITKDGHLTIHLPIIPELPGSQLDSEGRVPKETLDTVAHIRRKTFELMKQAGVPEEGDHIDYLLGNESVTFDAETCLQFGIVERII